MQSSSLNQYIFYNLSKCNNNFNKYLFNSKSTYCLGFSFALIIKVILDLSLIPISTSVLITSIAFLLLLPIAVIVLILGFYEVTMRIEYKLDYLSTSTLILLLSDLITTVFMFVFAGDYSPINFVCTMFMKVLLVELTYSGLYLKLTSYSFSIILLIYFMILTGLDNNILSLLFTILTLSTVGVINDFHLKAFTTESQWEKNYKYSIDHEKSLFYKKILNDYSLIYQSEHFDKKTENLTPYLDILYFHTLGKLNTDTELINDDLYNPTIASLQVEQISLKLVRLLAIYRRRLDVHIDLHLKNYIAYVMHFEFNLVQLIVINFIMFMRELGFRDIVLEISSTEEVEGIGHLLIKLMFASTEQYSTLKVRQDLKDNHIFNNLLNYYEQVTGNRILVVPDESRPQPHFTLDIPCRVSLTMTSMTKFFKTIEYGKLPPKNLQITSETLVEYLNPDDYIFETKHDPLKYYLAKNGLKKIEKALSSRVNKRIQETSFDHLDLFVKKYGKLELEPIRRDISEDMPKYHPGSVNDLSQVEMKNGKVDLDKSDNRIMALKPINRNSDGKKAYRIEINENNEIDLNEIPENNKIEYNGLDENQIGEITINQSLNVKFEYRNSAAKYADYSLQNAMRRYRMSDLENEEEQWDPMCYNYINSFLAKAKEKKYKITSAAEKKQLLNSIKKNLTNDDPALQTVKANLAKSIGAYTDEGHVKSLKKQTTKGKTNAKTKDSALLQSSMKPNNQSQMDYNEEEEDQDPDDAQFNQDAIMEKDNEEGIDDVDDEETKEHHEVDLETKSNSVMMQDI